MPRLKDKPRSRRSDRAARPRRRPTPAVLRWLLHGGGVLLLLAALAAGGAWIWHVGWVTAAVQRAQQAVLQATAAAGFRIEEVLVTGRTQTDAAALLAALAVGRGDPIFALDPEAARRAIEALPWVRRARIERRLPDSIHVRIEERRPMALWQNEQRLKLIDDVGSVLTDRDLGAYAGLPLVVGADAPRLAPGFLAQLTAHPAIRTRVVAAVRVGGRRWDLRLDNGVSVRLPEQDLAAALQRLEVLAERDRVFDRDIIAIDLRLGDRLIIQTSPVASERRHLPEENT